MDRQSRRLHVDGHVAAIELQLGWASSALPSRLQADSVLDGRGLNVHDWKLEIVRNAYWKQLQAQYDKNHLFPWRLPKVAATEEQVVAAERAVGFVFPQDYRDFLLHANGWVGFHLGTDLFGTPDFVSGRAREPLRRAELANYLGDIGLDPHEYIPIGTNKDYFEDFILLSPSARHLPGGVIWFSYDEVDRFNSYFEFFSSMINYNAGIAMDMKADSDPSKRER